jgi:hypothetical protein
MVIAPYRRITNQMADRRDLLGAAGVFLGAAGLLWWLAGQRLVWINDEGIYLDGARRILAGQMPYRDFFVLTGPGTFWNVAVFFKLFGVSLASARALFIFDVALIAACLYWLAAELRSRALGFWLAWFFVALLAGDAGGLVVNHRWDSAALSIMGVTLLAAGLRSESRWTRWTIAGAGAAAAYAAWVTPPVLLVLAPMFAWTFFVRRWNGVVSLAAGVVAVSALAGGALLATGSLGPMLHHFAWTASQYSTANRFPYGGIIGGYPALFSDAHGLELWVRAILVFFIVLPAVVPICALLGFSAARQLWKTPLLFILACAIALVLASAPRMDAAHLTYASPLSYVVAGCALASLLPERLRAPLAMALSLGACILMWNGVNQRLHLETTQTRGGVVFGEPKDLVLERALEASVQKGEPLFVFPYIPIAYFLTQGANPTRYSFLQPGMMADSDEDQALASLMSAPPVKVFYMDVPEGAYLRLFPSSDPRRLRMHKLEKWLRENYNRDAEFAHRSPGYDLLIRRQPGSQLSPLSSQPVLW